MNEHAWAQRVFGPLLTDHDLLLVDNRGSGISDTIDCPQVQKSLTPATVADCRKMLGSSANDYSTIAAVDDLEAVLTRIHARAVDLYGQSYGTFFAQVFALRYPQQLERLVLDGAYPLEKDPWSRDSLPTGLAGLRATCNADPTCRASGDPVALVARALARLRTGGTQVDKTSLGADLLASLLANAGRAGSAYRELPAALHSYLAGNNKPLFRLLNQASGRAYGSDSVSATSDSIGLEVADDCSDYPQPFDLHASLAVQKRQLDDAFAKVAKSTAHTLAPFTPNEALVGTGDCIGWPPPAHGTPQDLRGTFPGVPTLVLEGSLDTVTPPTGARQVAREFRRGRYVLVPFVGHLTALTDTTNCAASIAATFMVNAQIDTRCIARVRARPQVVAFPVRYRDEPPITLNGHQSPGLSVDDRRTIGIARDAVADVLWQWARIGQANVKGLWSGSAASLATGLPGEYLLNVHNIQWTQDTTVDGDINVAFHLERGIDSMTAHLAVATPAGRAQLTIDSAHILGPSAVEDITGHVDGHPINVNVNADVGL